MQHDLICSWLDLPPGSWPPDHYALLGLEPGEADVERIEHQVHERLARLRQHQLNHPDEATEAMNRLAQAFTCLTDPKAKTAYDAAMRGQPVASSPAAPLATVPMSAAPAELPVGAAAPSPSDPLAWLFGPWSDLTGRQAGTPPAAGPVQLDWSQAPPPPVRVEEAPAPPAEAPAEVNGMAEPETPAAAEPETPAAVEPPAPPEPVDPTIQAAQQSLPARRGLGTKRALYNRIARTRELLHAWDQAGKFLGQPSKRLLRKDEAAELKDQLAAIRQGLQRFPPILGGSGQPGYYVVSLARLPMIIPTFRALLPGQREEIAEDWLQGRKLLVSHMDFLRQQVRHYRKKGPGAWMIRAVRTFLYEHTGLVLLVVAVLALLVALCVYLSQITS